MSKTQKNSKENIFNLSKDKNTNNNINNGIKMGESNNANNDLY